MRGKSFVLLSSLAFLFVLGNHGEAFAETDKEIKEEKNVDPTSIVMKNEGKVKTFDKIDEIRLNNSRNPFEDPDSTKNKKNELIKEAKRQYDLENQDLSVELDLEEFESGKEVDENDTDESDIDNSDKEVIKDEEEIDESNNKENNTEIDKIIKAKSEKYGIEENIIRAVIEEESNYQKDKVSENTNGTVDRGLMQINSGTAPWLAEKMNIKYEVGIEFNSDVNIEMGSYYLKYLKGIRDDIHYILTAYNRGPTGAERWFSEHQTYESDYSKRLFSKIKELE